MRISWTLIGILLLFAAWLESCPRNKANLTHKTRAPVLLARKGLAEGRMLQKSALQRPWQGAAQRARAQEAAHSPGLLPAPSWQPLSCAGDEPFPAEMCQLTEAACGTNTCQLPATLGWRCFLFHPHIYLLKRLPFASLPAEPPKETLGLVGTEQWEMLEDPNEKSGTCSANSFV